MPLALTRGRDGHAPQVLIARRGNEAEIFPHFLIHFFFRHANAGGRSEIEHANLSAITDNGNLIDGNLLIAFDQNRPLPKNLEIGMTTDRTQTGPLRTRRLTRTRQKVSKNAWLLHRAGGRSSQIERRWDPFLHDDAALQGLDTATKMSAAMDASRRF